MVVFSELSCQGENVPFREQLQSSGIELPADGAAAEALVLDQVAAAREITNREWPDIATVVELAEQGPEWWNDSRISLLALPRVTTCFPENRCATFSNKENVLMDKQNPDLEMTRMKYAYRLAVFGIGLSVLLVIVLVFAAGMRTAADIVAIVGLFTSVTGTLVGAFFGLQIGSAGKEQERQERREAQKKAEMALGMLSPEQAEKVMEEMGTNSG